MESLVKYSVAIEYNRSDLLNELWKIKKKNVINKSQGQTECTGSGTDGNRLKLWIYHECPNPRSEDEA